MVWSLLAVLRHLWHLLLLLPAAAHCWRLCCETYTTTSETHNHGIMNGFAVSSAVSALAWSVTCHSLSIEAAALAINCMLLSMDMPVTG